MIPKTPLTETVFIFRTRKTGVLRIVPFGRDEHGFSSPTGKEVRIAPGDDEKLYASIFKGLSKNSTQKFSLRKVPDAETERELREDQLIGIKRVRKSVDQPWSYKIIAFRRNGSGFGSIDERAVSERTFERDAIKLIMTTFERIP